jgi:hypothetical protein
MTSNLFRIEAASNVGRAASLRIVGAFHPRELGSPARVAVAFSARTVGSRRFTEDLILLDVSDGSA